MNTKNKKLIAIAVAIVSMCYLTSKAQEINSVQLNTSPFEASSGGYLVGAAGYPIQPPNPYWTNDTGKTVRIVGAQINAGADGQIQEIDLAGILYIDQKQILSMRWDRYAQPGSADSGPVFFPAGRYFALPPGGIVNLVTYAQAWMPSYRPGMQAQFWCTVYWTY